jgi:hypothetical protein
MTTTGFTGIWKLNPAQSDIPSVTRSQTLTIETDGDHVSMREELVNDRDEHLTIAFQGRFDGRDYPVSGTPFADTVAYRLLSPTVIEGVAKKDGRVCVKETATLLDGGAFVSVTYLSFDAQGNTLENHGLFERVVTHQHVSS